jgi:hypothetical protein
VEPPAAACRVEAYGSGSTHGDAVADGETWAEMLAAHLNEPVRNYGAGDYSFYQTYRRMLRVFQQHQAGGQHPELIVLTICESDHYGNLEQWPAIRLAGRPGCGQAGYKCEFPRPCLRVNVDQGATTEVDALFSKPEQLHRLGDQPEFLWATFGADPILKMELALRQPYADMARIGERANDALVNPVAEAFGIRCGSLSLLVSPVCSSYPPVSALKNLSCSTGLAQP